jgi:hypothetical protein
MALMTRVLVRIIEPCEEHGTPRKVFVYQTVFHDGTRENPGVEVRGLDTLLVEDGPDVTALDHG